MRCETKRCHARRQPGLILILAGLLALAQPPAGAGQSQTPEPSVATGAPASIEADLRSLLSAEASPEPAIPPPLFAALRRVYASHADRALWVGPLGPSPAGTALLAQLVRARDAGAAASPAMTAALEASAPGAGSGVVPPARLELLLSAALLETAVDPQDPASAAKDPAPLLQAVASASDPARLLPRLLPGDPAFWRLRATLPAYRAIEARGGWPSLPPGPNLALGDRGARVEALRRRLVAGGDLAEAQGGAEIFDAALDEAVRRFQARTGLAVDGVVGPRTLEQLNAPVTRRLATIAVNLARLLQRPREWGARYVAVNLAAARYRLVDGGRTLLDRPAIVGQRGWPTPLLDGVIDRLEFNPYWTVPARIARLELLPKIARDAGYMRRNDMHWVNGQIRQDPGPKNPLGVVKFRFPNSYDVYLHDTNNRALFDRPDRFLSHGCIRIAGALDLAAYLLQGDPQWPPERIAEIVAAGPNLPVDLPHPIPVHLVYDTAWVDEDGTLEFRADVYGLDRDLAMPAIEPAAGPSSSCSG